MKVILPEIVAIGIYNSQLAVKNVSITKNRRTTMFEIEIPIEDGGVSYIDNEQMPIGHNMIICAKPGQIRHTRLPFRCYYVHIILREGELLSALEGVPNYVEIINPEKYLEIFRRLCKYSETAVKNDEIILQSLILELIHTLINDAQRLEVRNNQKSSNYKAVEKVIKYIKDNINSELSLNTIAAYAGFSPVHFHNVFRASTGKTLRDYVEEQRIRKAADMLVTTDFTLAEIAYECGFSSQSYFSYAFKRRMKLTPRDYAKEVFARYDK